MPTDRRKWTEIVCHQVTQGRQTLVDPERGSTSSGTPNIRRLNLTFALLGIGWCMHVRPQDDAIKSSMNGPHEVVALQSRVDSQHAQRDLPHKRDQTV